MTIEPSGDRSRTATRTAHRHGLRAMALMIAGAIVFAPLRGATQTAPPDASEIKKRTDELEAAREEQRKAAERAAALQKEAAAIGQDRAKLNAQLIETAARVRALETEIDSTEMRLKPLDERETILRRSLDERRGVTMEVLAALQRAGRRAPPALLIRPEDALRSLRTAIMLGAVVPELKAEASRLAADLDELLSLRRNISKERDRLAADRDRLKADQEKMAALITQRQAQQRETEKEMAAERARAETLSSQAANLQELIAKMEMDLASAAKAAAQASLQGAPPGKNGKPDLGAFKDPGRLTPAIAFTSAKGLLPLPVSGLKIREFGAPDGAGGSLKGLSIATRAGAQVTAPCDGWVVYAGPFRSYGQLLILNAGGGYHVLLAGMERISVNIGQFVLTGEPVATMGSGSQVAAILATAPTQPVLYIEFRKDGAPIDPSPWWASTDVKKVRG